MTSIAQLFGVGAAFISAGDGLTILKALSGGAVTATFPDEIAVRHGPPSGLGRGHGTYAHSPHARSATVVVGWMDPIQERIICLLSYANGQSMVQALDLTVQALKQVARKCAILCQLCSSASRPGPPAPCQTSPRTVPPSTSASSPTSPRPAASSCAAVAPCLDCAGATALPCCSPDGSLALDVAALLFTTLQVSLNGSVSKSYVNSPLRTLTLGAPPAIDAEPVLTGPRTLGAHDLMADS